MPVFRHFLVSCFAITIVSMAYLDAQATGRARCRRSEVPVPPGNYSIVVAGSNEKSIAEAIERVVAEERHARPTLFENSNISVYNGGNSILAAQKAVTIIMVGNVSAPASYVRDPNHLLIAVPKIYENGDPQYVQSSKISTAGIHLALRSILFFSGEARETDETMGTEHFVSLPDEFAESAQDEQHKH